MAEATQTDGSQEKRKPKDYNEAQRLILADETPHLGLKLGRMYEFKIAEGDKPIPTLVKNFPIGEYSYLADKLGVATDLEIPVDLAQKGSTLKLPPGVTMIIGRSGSGKTALALSRMNALNDNTIYARFGEPLDRRFALELATVGADEGLFLHQHEAKLAEQIARFLFADDLSVMIIDSLRYLVYAGGGATGKGGVNMSLFADISFLDVVAARRGKSLVIIINPLTDDDAAYKNIVEAAVGSVAALIDVESPNRIKYTSRFNADRSFRTFSLPDLDSISNNDGRHETLNVKSATTVDLRRIAS